MFKDPNHSVVDQFTTQKCHTACAIGYASLGTVGWTHWSITATEFHR
jgi:hypothetical protein